jgi:hypothetical protein
MRLETKIRLNHKLNINTEGGLTVKEKENLMDEFMFIVLRIEAELYHGSQVGEHSTGQAEEMQAMFVD